VVVVISESTAKNFLMPLLVFPTHKTKPLLLRKALH